MSTGTTKKRKRGSKAARQRQGYFIIGGAALVLILVVGLVLGFLLDNIDYADTDTDTIYLLKGGKIVSTDIEDFDETKYDKEKLGTYVKNVIDTYNSKNGKGKLVQNSYKVKDNKAVLVLEYANADVYEEINGVELFTGTVAAAKEAGYDFKADFVELKKGKTIEASADKFIDGKDYKVIIIKSNTKVVLTKGEVCFVSTQNVAEVGEDYVLIKDGASLGQSSRDTETLGTENEGSDGVIGEDELVPGEGEDEIIFDFGDEPEEEESQYSAVLTYIIYK